MGGSERARSAGQDISGHRKGRVPRAVRRKQILDLAQEMFIAEGFDGTSIEAICRAADVSRPVMYDVVGNKSDAYLACVRRVRAELNDALAVAIRQAEDPFEVLRSSTEVWFEVIERTPGVLDLLYGGTGTSRELSEELMLERAKTVEKIEQFLAASAPEADPLHIKVYANLVSGSFEQLGRWWFANKELLPREEAVQLEIEFIWRALSPVVNQTEGTD